MQQKQRLWKRRSFIVALCASVLGLGLVGYLLYLGYQVAWTGFSVPACPTNQPCPSNKTLWDWLQLFVVPLALAGAGFWFSQVQKKTELEIAQKQKERDLEIAQKQKEHDLEIAKDTQRENLLQAYLDRMTELLLKESLRTSQPDSEVRNVARVRTLTILGQLDTQRNNHVLSFLREAQLITSQQGKSIVSLSNADMSGMNFKKLQAYDIDLSGADLSGADLSGADLSKANLSGANLFNVNLTSVILDEANLSGTDLSKANLSGINLNGANLSGTDLSKANLRFARLSRANLCKADLSEADLHRANLSGADLSKANLSGADLSKANLRRADLSFAKLAKAVYIAYHFTGADTTTTYEDDEYDGANLSGADLSGADLSGADLSGADLSGANLSETILDGASIQKALNVTKEQIAKADII